MLTDITPEHVLSWGPCERYPEHRIRAIYGDRPSMTPSEILSLDDIPAGDRLWAVLRPEVLGERSMRLIAADIAATVLHLYEAQYPGDMRPRTAIETARRYAAGRATREELDAARCAAWAAAGRADDRAAARAARAAAWAANGDAACAAAWATAWAAVGATRDAAGSAWDAGGAAESEAQIDIVRGFIAQETRDE